MENIKAIISRSRLNPETEEVYTLLVTLFPSIQTSLESELQQVRFNIEETETRNGARITALELNLIETEAQNEARITSLYSKSTAL